MLRSKKSGDTRPGDLEFRNLDLDAPFRSQNLRALECRALRGNSEVEMASRAEVQQRAGQAVGPEFRVAVYQCNNSDGFRLEEKSARQDRRCCVPRASDVF